MKKRKIDIHTTPELLFVAASSQDAKGRRVLVRDVSGCENWIYPEPGVTDMDMRLLSITSAQRGQIERFFAGDRV